MASAYMLSQTVSKCASSIENILVQARKSFSGKPNFKSKLWLFVNTIYFVSVAKEDFIEENYKSILGQAINEYSSLFNRLLMRKSTYFLL